MCAEFYFHQKNEFPRCVLCGTPHDITWCGRCGEFFCPRCSRNIPLRIKAMRERNSINIISQR